MPLSTVALSEEIKAVFKTAEVKQMEAKTLLLNRKESLQSFDHLSMGEKVGIGSFGLC
jgi:hypothetical protein